MSANAPKRVIPYSDFDMRSVKYNSKNGVEVNYFNKDTGRHENPSDAKNAPHPDFLNALKALAPHVVHILGLQKGWDHSREHISFQDKEEALQAAVRGAKEADESFTVSGIRLSGEGKNASAKITGSLKCLSGATGLSSPLINFQNTALGIEQTIEKLCEKVKEETYSFLFTGKVAAKQEEMDFDEGSDPDVDQPIKNTRKGGGKNKAKNKQLDVEEEAAKAENNEEGSDALV